MVLPRIDSSGQFYEWFNPADAWSDDKDANHAPARRPHRQYSLAREEAHRSHTTYDSIGTVGLASFSSRPSSQILARVPSALPSQRRVLPRK